MTRRRHSHVTPIVGAGRGNPRALRRCPPAADVTPSVGQRGVTRSSGGVTPVRQGAIWLSHGAGGHPMQRQSSVANHRALRCHTQNPGWGRSRHRDAVPPTAARAPLRSRSLPGRIDAAPGNLMSEEHPHVRETGRHRGGVRAPIVVVAGGRPGAVTALPAALTRGPRPGDAPGSRRTGGLRDDRRHEGPWGIASTNATEKP